jgi:hypothetical protein
MNWVLICLVGFLLLTIANTLATLIFTQQGDEDRVQNLSFVKRMKAQAIMFGKASRAFRNPWQRENDQYEKLAKMVDELGVDKNEKE